MTDEQHLHSNNLAKKILIAMLLGLIVGVILNLLPDVKFIEVYVIEGFLTLVGKIFIAIITMLVVPIVFVSLVTGTSSLDDSKRFGMLAVKTLTLYLFTTAVAITLGLCVSALFSIGSAANLGTSVQAFKPQASLSFIETLINIVPKNPVAALAKGNMLQIILFSILLGIAINLSGNTGKRVAKIFSDFNEVMMRLIFMIMQTAPYGVFCLISSLFAKFGFGLIVQLLGYFVTVIVVLMLQLFIVYPALLSLLGQINPLTFFKKMYSAMLFAFSVSSSNASIPVVLQTVRDDLGVDNSVASFVVPLGATINMDGTAIMQGVATVFIAHAYNIDIGLTGYLMVVLTATLASIGTAGVPGVGLITLTMVLQQVGLPVEGIALIIGIDRLLDMLRTSVNVAGDATVATVVAKSEAKLDTAMYKEM